MYRKNLIVAVIAIFIFGSLFYLSTKRDNEIIVEKNVIAGRPTVIWQKISIAEEMNNISITMRVPRVIIRKNYDLKTEVNKEIKWRIESLKNDFISAVSTAAEDNGETSTLNIDTEVLLITPRLISLAFTATEYLAGTTDDDTQQTFLIFDLTNDKMMIERHELFRDIFSWSKATKTIKTSLFSSYQEEPNCDLLFAPKHNGLAASCIGVDFDRGGEHISIRGDIPASLVQEFLAPSILSDIIQQAATDEQYKYNQ